VKVVSKPKNFSADSLPYNPHRECREHLHLRQVQVWANGAKFCFFSREIRVIRAIRDKKSPTIPTMYGREAPTAKSTAKDAKAAKSHWISWRSSRASRFDELAWQNFMNALPPSRN
jgi:hypothetical protein